MNNTRYFDFLIDYRTFNRVMTNETCMFTQQWFVQGIAITAPIDELSHKIMNDNSRYGLVLLYTIRTIFYCITI